MKRVRRHSDKRNNRRRRFLRRWWLLKRDKKNRQRKRNHGWGGRPFIFSPEAFGLNEYTAGSVSVTPEHKFIITLPEKLDFDENYESTVSHFKTLRSAIRNGALVQRLVFDGIRYISPAAALVLASEVDRWNQRVGHKLRATVESWYEDIKRLLHQMGYFELLNIPPPESLGPPKNTTFLKFKRGDLSDRDSGRVAKQLRTEIEAIVGMRIKKHFLFEGLSEAITNVSQHAYPSIGIYIVKQWWLSASYDSETKFLTVMFYDQGVGIPKTLEPAKVGELFKDVFHNWTDSQRIEAAMEIGRSSSEGVERGKGLQNLIEFAQSHPEGSLTIYSLQGMYKMLFIFDGVAPVATNSRKDHDNSIGGTLIEWKVKLV